MEIIPKKIRKLWSEEEIRFLVLFSLFLQIILISFSLFRKRSTKKALSLLLWLSYLGADSIAMLALGNLLNKQNDAVEANTSGDIMAFWAPFLLLHLGGPDTITSYSLEDNELWRRHLLNLIAQVVIAIFVFLESLPSPHVWKSAIIVFVAGILKYAERTVSLFYASMKNLRESMLGEADPGPNYAKFMQELHSRKEASVKVEIKIEKEPRSPLPQEEAKDISEREVIYTGYHFFKTLKLLTVDLMLSFQDRIESQNFFLRRNAKQAFQVVEVELSFLHDILHTKLGLVYSIYGLIARVASLAMAVLALLLFHHRSGKDSHVFKSVDVLITYLLLLIAIGLEFVAILLLIFSDWAIVTLQMSSSDLLEQPRIAYVKKKLSTTKWSEVIINLRKRFLSVFPVWLLGDTERWWSNKMRQYNLLEVCLREYNYKCPNLDRMLKLVKLVKLVKVIDDMRNQCFYVKSKSVVDEIKNHIFDQLKMKAKSTDSLAENYKRLRACRGEWVLREKGYTNLKWSVEKEFDESILIWHIATYLCHQTSVPKKTDSTDDADQVWRRISKFCAGIIEIGKKLRSRMKSSIGRITQIVKPILRRSRSQQDYMTNKLGDVERESRDGENEEDEEGSSDSSAVSKTATGKRDADKTADEKKKLADDYIKISRKISKYLIYLVVYQPQLLPAGIGKIRFIDTCAEAKKFFSDKETEMREELQNTRPAEDKKKTTRKDMKNSIFRNLGFLFFRQCFAKSIKRVPISKELVQYIRNRWTAITKIVFLKKIHQFFCFCIEVAKEIMQPKYKKPTPEMKRLGCEKLMEVKTTEKPIEVKGDRSKSVLFDAVKLAREIMENFKTNEGEEQKNMNKDEKMWEVMSSVWMEMLCYAAGNSASYAHGTQLSQGGELVTHVWLLMTHMGIGEQYRIEAGHARAKLLVET